MSLKLRKVSYLSEELLEEHDKQYENDAKTPTDVKDPSSEQEINPNVDKIVDLICLNDGNKTLQYSHVIYRPKESFIVESFKWILSIIASLCFIILSPLLLFLSLTLFVWPLINTLKLYFIFLLISLFLPSMYIVSFFVDITIDAFCSIYPVILAILFKDAIIFSTKFKYTVEHIYHQRELAYDFKCCTLLLSPHLNTKLYIYKLFCGYCCTSDEEFYYFTCCNFCGSCCCIGCIFARCNYYGTLIFGKIIKLFLISYHVWGITFKHYVPFNEMSVHIHNEDSDEIAPKKTIKKMSDLLPTIVERGLNLSPIYSTSNKIWKYTMMLFCGIPVLIPNTYYFFRYILPQLPDYSPVIFWALGVIISIFVFSSINNFIEIIFYRLLKYYIYMNAMSTIIQIPQKQISGNIDIRVCGHWENVDFSSDIQSAEIDVDVYFNRKNKLMSKKSDTTVYLWENENSVVWLENWCELQTIAALYFANQKNIVFSTFITLIATLALFLYYYITEKPDSIWNIINPFTSLAFCVLLYFLIVLSRLMFWSIKLTNLEARQIELILCQKIRTKQHAFALHKNNNIDKKEWNILMESYKLKCGFMDDMSAMIKKRSASPRIGGVKLDALLTKFLMSSLFGVIVSIISVSINNVSTN
eukprot:300661_1